MAVQGLVGFIMDVVGKLIDEMGQAIASWGNYVYTLSNSVTAKEALTNGIFGTNNGLIYWLNDKIVSLLNNLLEAPFGANLHTFLSSLLGGTP